MDVDINVALEEADAAVHYGDSLGPTFAAVLAAEVRSLHEQLDTCRRSRDGWQDAVKRLRDELDEERFRVDRQTMRLRATAAELEQAQAAIARVRDLCAKAKPGRPTLAPSVFVADVLRELDGEEG